MRILKNSNFDFMSKKVLALGLSAIIVFREEQLESKSINNPIK